MRTVSILGVGRAGGAIAIALDRAGYRIDRLITRSTRDLSEIADRLVSEPVVGDAVEFSGADDEVLIIATGDQEIAHVVADLAAIRLPSTVLHLSGALSSEVLAPLRERGIGTGSMHPLVALSDAISGALRFEGTYFCVEGDASEVAEQIAADLGGRAFSIPTEKKALYHAAAVTASGNFVALVDAAIEMLLSCGLESETARKLLLPLIGSTYENLQEKSTHDALTGPYARADVEAFHRHNKALANEAENLREIYLALAARSVELMARVDPKNEAYEELAEVIRIAKEKLEC